MKKALIIILHVLVVAFILYLFLKPKPVPPIPDNKPELEKIDSLKEVIKVREDAIAILRDSIDNIKTVVIVQRVETIKELPINETAELLKENLLEHGELTEPTDTLPKLYEFSEPIIALSENNAKDVNIIAAKLEEERNINTNLEAIILESEYVISEKDSILLQTNSILQKNETYYNESLEAMKKNIKKQKVIAYGTAAVCGAALIGVLIGGLRK